MKYTENEILNFAIENDKIDLHILIDEMDMQERTALLNMHPYKIWKGSDNYYYTYFPDEQNGRIRKKRATKEDLEEQIVEYWKSRIEIVTVEDVFNEWNDRRLNLGQIAPATHDRNIRIFERHFSVFGKKDIKKIQPEDIEDFLEEQISVCNLNAKAYANLKTITRGFLKRAKKRKLIDFNVEEMLSEMDLSDTSFSKSKKSDKDEIFNDKELPRLMNYLIEHPDMSNLGILLILVTGLRVGELVALKWSDLSSTSIYVHRTETTYEKDGKTVHVVKDSPKTSAGVRTVLIPKDYSWTVDKLREYNSKDEYVFSKKGTRYTTDAIRRRFYKACDEIGIPRRSPHKGRKTYASILLDHNVGSAFIISQMGHTNITCTENYYHKDRKSLETKAAIINGINEFWCREDQRGPKQM